MPRRAKGPRLYLDRGRGEWVIRDGQRFVRTGCAERSRDDAERALASYLGRKHRPEAGQNPLIADVLLAYGSEVAPHLRTAKDISYQLGSLRKWWGAKRISEITARNCRAYAAGRPASSARKDLQKLQAALRHWHKEYGPLPSVPLVTAPPEPAPRERWLTRAEAARLLWGARRVPHLRRFILLGIYTGSRSSVLREVQWSWIDFETRIMLRRAPGAAERDKKRRPPVRLGSRILSHLRRWKRLDGDAGRYVVHYNGKPIREAFRSSWGRAVAAAKLNRGVTPHTLRHTRATWLMQAGIDIWEAAGALGMSVKTLERVYGHHHPDWQGSSAEV